ncbi:PHP domain-containing protein [Dankookia rubra]|uniref:PHP domain-containing protein n=1 Tax=Dankookia rubra TaxID=1442381 RepID=UPI001F4FCFF6|nr:PHP domain-containing protein [Dankookia rubra]
MAAFAELGARSNFSFLDGASHPEELAQTAQALGLAGLGICDLNSLAGAVRGHVAAKAAGLAFRVGCRLRLDDGSEWLAWPGSRAAYGRLTALLSRGRMQAPKGECRISRAAMLAAAEGWVLAAIPRLRRRTTGSPCHLDLKNKYFSLPMSERGLLASIRSHACLPWVRQGEEVRMAEEMPYSSSLPDFGRFPWDDLYPRLLLAALGRLGPTVWRGERRGEVPGGRTAHDAVQTAVEKFLGGERQWNRSKSAFENLWGAVSSEISNWTTSAENRTTSRTDGEKVILLRNSQPTPEEQVLWRSERDRLLQHLHAKDVNAARMAELMLVEGLKGPELAERMGLEQHKTDAIKKRLRRLVTAYVEADGEGSRRAAE